MDPVEDAKGKVFAFADPNSTSGYLVPGAKLPNERELAQHARAVCRVHHRRVDGRDHVVARAAALHFEDDLPRDLFGRDELHLPHVRDGLKLALREEAVLARVDDHDVHVAQRVVVFARVFASPR